MDGRTKQRVTVGVSGGVDSAVAALLLLEQGCEVSALFMKNWEEDDDERCAAAADLASARAVCERLGVPLRTVNFSHEYWNHVFRRFLDEYQAGRTPNPDTLCNREIKFKAFLEFAQSLGADTIATGHYAGVERRGVGDNAAWRLLRGGDPAKDQSYFLYQLDQRALRRTLFPLAKLRKTEVRALAKARRLPCHDRKDSTGICFIGERNLREFLSRYITAAPGDIVDEAGQTLGRHHGAAFYTIGQRAGLGIGGRRDGDNRPWYVAAKDMAANRLTVVQGRDHPALLRDTMLVDDLHWIDPAAADAVGAEPLTARCRHRQPDSPCQMAPCGDGQWRVRFAEPQWAVAPGQAMVFYRGPYCLGGATITA